MNSANNNQKLSKPAVEKENDEMVARYSKASYFIEKDKKAADFLKKHPVPAKFLK